MMVSLATRPSNGQYGSSWMQAAVRFCHDAERLVSEPHDKLKRYVESPLEDVENVVTWWGVSAIFTATLKSRLHLHSPNYSITLYSTQHSQGWQGISHYPRLSYSLRESILEWWYHWHCQVQPPHT